VSKYGIAGVPPALSAKRELLALPNKMSVSKRVGAKVMQSKGPRSGKSNAGETPASPQAAWEGLNASPHRAYLESSLDGKGSFYAANYAIGSGIGGSGCSFGFEFD
jgi:hypothetical protein